MAGATERGVNSTADSTSKCAIEGTLNDFE